MKDLLGERCRDELLSEGRKHEVPERRKKSRDNEDRATHTTRRRFVYSNCIIRNTEEDLTIHFGARQSTLLGKVPLSHLLEGDRTDDIIMKNIIGTARKMWDQNIVLTENRI